MSYSATLLAPPTSGTTPLVTPRVGDGGWTDPAPRLHNFISHSNSGPRTPHLRPPCHASHPTSQPPSATTTTTDHHCPPPVSTTPSLPPLKHTHGNQYQRCLQTAMSCSAAAPHPCNPPSPPPGPPHHPQATPPHPSIPFVQSSTLIPRPMPSCARPSSARSWSLLILN
jgi:hypothetical protein